VVDEDNNVTPLNYPAAVSHFWDKPTGNTNKVNVDIVGYIMRNNDGIQDKYCIAVLGIINYLCSSIITRYTWVALADFTL